MMHFDLADWFNLFHYNLFVCLTLAARVVFQAETSSVLSLLLSFVCILIINPQYVLDCFNIPERIIYVFLFQVLFPDPSRNTTYL